MTCETARPAPLRCPTLSERIAATLALLPTGRAWGSDGGAPEPYRDAPFDGNVFDAAAFDTESRPGTIIYRFFAALASVLNYAEIRLCALRDEFFCATQVETRDLWMQEYDLPNACDPFPDLCAKVAALGGARCDYFADVAARAGWSVTCENAALSCGGQMGCAQMGASQTGAVRANVLRLVVDLAGSPSYVGRTQTPPVMGRLMMGQPIACDPDISPLQCIIERIAPAHVEVEYIISN